MEVEFGHVLRFLIPRLTLHVTASDPHCDQFDGTGKMPHPVHQQFDRAGQLHRVTFVITEIQFGDNLSILERDVTDAVVVFHCLAKDGAVLIRLNGDVESDQLFGQKISIAKYQLNGLWSRSRMDKMS